jgi:hypothetical protein
LQLDKAVRTAFRRPHAAPRAEGTLRRKISNAPALIRPLPVSVGSPASQSERKPEPKPLIEATSPAAILACHRFWRAASDCERAIEMAYSPEVDETHWASVKQQWLVWQHDAQCRAQACKTERLPEPLLTEVLTKLHSLDRLWEIACDYRIKAADAKSQIAEASRRKYRQWHRPQVEKGVQRIANHVQGTGCTLDDLKK